MRAAKAVVETKINAVSNAATGSVGGCDRSIRCCFLSHLGHPVCQASDRFQRAFSSLGRSIAASYRNKIQCGFDFEPPKSD